jgi:hypothetical protein
MNRPAIALVALLLAACSSESDSGGAKYGCALAEKAFVAYDDSVDGARNNTATPADLIKDMNTVKDKMEEVASIANGELKVHAESAALSAGRIRVALSGGDADVTAEASSLRKEMLAASTLCHA